MNRSTSIESISNQALKDNSSTKAQKGSINELNDEIDHLKSELLSNSNSRNNSARIQFESSTSSSSKDSISSLNNNNLINSKMNQEFKLINDRIVAQVHCDREGKKIKKRPNKKLEVKSLENLSSLANYCDTCDTVHRPCCPFR